jgi:hypothetical protein
MRDEKLELWDDTRIQPGKDWAAEIETAISRARVGVMLVSPEFLASDYVIKVELPAMLKQRSDGLSVLWIPVRSSLYEATPLNAIQAACDPSVPLASLPSGRRDKALVEVARRIATAADVNAVANAFKVIDEFAPQLDAFMAGKPQSAQPAKHRVVASQVDEKITFESAEGHTLEVITAEDLLKLDAGSQQLIRAYERTIKELYDRWTELLPKTEARDKVVRREAEEEADEVRKKLCKRLNELLAFLMQMGKSLHDHYQAFRFVCQQTKS